MKKIKILTISPDLRDEGGVGRVVFSLNDYFSSKIENQIIVIKTYDDFFIRLIKTIFNKKCNVKKNSLSSDCRIVYIKKTIFSKLFSEKFKQKKILKQIENELNIHNYDVIHGHFFNGPGELSIKLAKKYNKKSVVTFHGSDAIDFTSYSCLEDTDFITFVSNYIYSMINNSSRLSSSKMKVIYNGIDSRIFKLEEVDYNRNIIAYAGRLNNIKGVHYLKDIYKQLNAYRIEKDKNLEIHIYGEGPERMSLEKYFQENNINVNFWGNVNSNDLAKAFQKVKILIVPSKKEGYSCIVQEGKACGAYVIASNVGGLPESIGAIGSLINVDNDFCGKMVDEIKSIYEQNLDVKEISEDCINYWEDIACKYEDIYMNLFE